MHIISVEHLCKSYGEKILFDDISFGVNVRERIGLIGVNGTGKSTLLKIMAGIESPDSGNLIHSNQFRVEYLPQNPEFDDQSPVLEQVFRGEAPLNKAMREYEAALLELEANPNDERKQNRLFQAQQQMDAAGAWEASAAAKTVLTKLGIRDFDKPVGQLSGGQRKRVAMARALIQPADLLILDEPTNHIDNETVEWLEQFLAKWKGALLIVTHDRYFLDRVTNRIIELDRGKLYSYEGNYAAYLEKKADRLERETAMEDKRQNLLRRELAWLRRGAKARTTKQKARVERVHELMDRKQDGPAEKLDMALAASRLGKKVLELDSVSVSVGGRALLQDFSYIVMPDDRIGIIGPNGSGKSTLLNVLAGRLKPDSGTLETGPTVKIAYYTQEGAEMDESLRVIEYIEEAAEVVHTANGEAVTAAQMLERFLFPPNRQWTPISRLSGGERRRLYLLRTLMGGPNVLLLDEPTNDLDIQTLTILEDYLESFPGAVITVSHDRYFLDKTTDRLFAYENGRLRRFEGSYSEYLQQREMEKQAPHTEEGEPGGHSGGKSASPRGQSGANVANGSGAKGEAEAKAAKPLRKLSFKDQKDWDEIEGKIASLEERIAQVKRDIETAGSDYGKVQELYMEEQKLSEQLEQAMDRWAELSELVEQIERNK